MIDKEDIRKELDLIQGCISRMAQNSFMVKGWTVTLYVAIITLSKIQVIHNCIVTLLFIVPFILFWGLDAYFLHTERKYRKLYEWVLRERPKGNDDHLFDLNLHRFEDQVCPCCSLMTCTIAPFYLIPIGSIWVLGYWI